VAPLGIGNGSLRCNSIRPDGGFIRETRTCAGGGGSAPERTNFLNRPHEKGHTVDRRTQPFTAMSPSSLLNVSPDLLRERAGLGESAAPMAEVSERNWAIGVCLALGVTTLVLILALA
jgi:hypothetical protein